MHADKHPASPPSAYQDLLSALEPLAREGRLAASLWEVCSFALGFAQKGKGFSAEVFDRAIRHLQVAQFNPELPFYPSSDPKEVVSWQELPEAARQAAALAAGVELVRGEPGSPWLGRGTLSHDTMPDCEPPASPSLMSPKRRPVPEASETEWRLLSCVWDLRSANPIEVAEHLRTRYKGSSRPRPWAFSWAAWLRGGFCAR